MNKNDTYRIRPAGRHLLTIGRDLIKDQCAAIAELVKNAYDADSPDVSISFNVPKSGDKLTIVVEDHGHGMSRETVTTQWLVPSTDDKLKRKKSPKARIMQGRKGIGRYAASILGKDLLLETVSENGEKTTVYIEWQHFENAQYLEDVEILVETESTSLPSGTVLTITADKKQMSEWGENQIINLKSELKKLTSPIPGFLHKSPPKDSFNIILCFDGFREGETERVEEVIKPFPIIDFFDYRISGTIKANGTGTLTYTNQKARNTIEETIRLNESNPTECGRLFFDIRVYDREKEAIELLIKRGLKDERGKYMAKRDARNLLNSNNGIGVYRNGFSIRPLGDPDFDWIQLNAQRIQNPSYKIGLNQVIGFVQIESEELSGLKEKSARDGLRENHAYEKLKNISSEVISYLETRRFEYRQKAGLSRTALKVERELEKLFAFDEIKRKIRRKLSQGKVDKKTADEIIRDIEKDEGKKKRAVDDLKEIVAIYQGQATLGKIINVVLHEGRRPLSFFKNQVSNLNYWAKKIRTNFNQETLDHIIPIADGMGHNADTFVKLFSRLDPLAAGKRGKKKHLKIKKSIMGAFHVFEKELKGHKISYEISGSEECGMDGWPQDIYSIFTNLIDNSIFWIVEKKCEIKRISVEVSSDKGHLDFIDYRDSGPGIEKHLIESGIIFEPEFSTKPGGTGLGLAIAGESATRNGVELKAFECDSGAYFRLQ